MQVDGLKAHNLKHRHKLLTLALAGLSYSSEDCKIKADDIQAVFFEAMNIEKDIESLFEQPTELKLAA